MMYLKTLLKQKLPDNNCVLILPIQGIDEQGYIFNTKEQLVQHIEGITKIYTGNANNLLKNICMKHNIELIEYLQDEVLVTQNSLLTAEAILSLCISETNKSIFDSNILVLGYGNCGKKICELLKKLNVTPTIYTKKEEDYSIAENYGIKTSYNLQDISEYDIIINTIPVNVLTNNDYNKISAQSFILDIVSKGVINHKLSKKLKLNTYIAPSLPGKYSPYTAAKVIFNYIYKYEK